MNIKVTFEADLPNFAKLSKKEQHPQKRVRLLALAQLKSGKGIGEVAKGINVHRHTVGNWYARYKKFGLAGLDNLPRSGRKPKLPKEREEEFIQRIEDLQRSKKGGRITGYDILEIAHNEFKANYADDYIYTVLNRLNMSWVTSRSQHPKANEEKQSTFKKTSNKRSLSAFQME